MTCPACAKNGAMATGSSANETGRGETAPSLSGPTFTGEVLDLADYEGRPVILNFWTTTCEPCIREIGLLTKAAVEHEDDGIVIIGVNQGEQMDRVATFIEELDTPIPYPIVLDTSGDAGRTFGVAVLPTTFFIDRSGIVQYRRIGEVRDIHFDEGWSRIK